MAYAVNPIDAFGKVTLTMASGEACNTGDLIALNGSGEGELADASDSSWALGVAGNNANGSDSQRSTVVVHFAAILEDLDTSAFTAESVYYLSTDGDVTATRPTTADYLRQVVGQAMTANLLMVRGGKLVEKQMVVNPSTFDTTGEPGLWTEDATVFTGPQLDGSGEDAYFSFRVPENAVGVPTVARLILNAIGAQTSTTISGSVSGGADGEANNNDTGTALTTKAPNAATDDLLAYVDISSMLDSGFWTPGRNCGMNLNEAAATNDAQALYIYITFMVVEPI